MLTAWLGRIHQKKIVRSLMKAPRSNIHFRQIDRWLDRTVSAAHCPAVLAPLAQGGELAPSKKLMAAAKLSRGSSLLRWRRRGNLRQEPEVDDGVVWHIRVAPGAWRAVITELVAQGKDVACDFFFERK